MAPGTQTVDLTTIAAGPAGEKFDHELRRLLQNIADPNTPAKAKRSITLAITIEPTEDREGASYVADVKVKLAGVRPQAGRMFLGEKNGQPVAVTFDPRQPDMFGEQDPNVTPLSPNREASQ